MTQRHGRFEIGMEHANTVLPRLLMKRSKKTQARVIDQHVNPAELFDRLVRQTQYLLMILDIGGQSLAGNTQGAARDSRQLKAILAAGGQHQRSAFFCECFGSGQPDAAGRSGDQDDLPVKPLGVGRGQGKQMAGESTP